MIINDVLLIEYLNNTAKPFAVLNRYYLTLKDYRAFKTGNFCDIFNEPAFHHISSIQY